MIAEITITVGHGTLRVVLPETVLDAFDEDGKEIMRDTVSIDAVAVYGELVGLLEAAGHMKPVATDATDATPAPAGPLPPGMPVPMHCGRPCEFKEAFVNPKTHKSVPAKYQCTNDDCPAKAETGGYKWSIFVDKYIKQMEAP